MESSSSEPIPAAADPAPPAATASVPPSLTALPVDVVEQRLPDADRSVVENTPQELPKPNLPPPLSKDKLAESAPQSATVPVVSELTPKAVSAVDEAVWLPTPELYWQQLTKACLSLRIDGVPAEKVIQLTLQLRARLSGGLTGLLAFGGSSGFVVQEQVSADSELWFIGDIHGDMLAFRALTHYAMELSSRNQRKALLFFLGDLFDDGDLAHGVLVDFFDLMLKFPGRVAFVAGNHDVGLMHDQQSGSFKSSVSPSDFADWLNLPSRSAEWREFARVAIDFFRAAPRAVLLPDGTLVAHGGFPLPDRHDRIQCAEDLNDEGCLEDFVWTRAHETARRRVPNRSTRGCSFGFQDFDAFCDLTAKILPLPVRRLIRGHDHVSERWSKPPSYARHPLLTINAMSWKQRDPFGSFERKPVIARWVRDQLPEVHRIEIPAERIREVYGTPLIA
jgi:hypothetical protein